MTHLVDESYINDYHPGLRPGVLRCARFKATHSRILTLASNKLVVVPAKDGLLYLPEWVTYKLTAGTAYGNLGTKYFGFFQPGSDTGRFAASVDSGTTAFFGAATERFAVHQGVGNSQAGSLFGDVGDNTNFNQPLRFGISGAVDINGGSSARVLSGRVWYREFSKEAFD